MPRLIDDIRAAGKLTVPNFVTRLHAWEQYTDQLWEVIRYPELPVIRIDNVAAYYFAGTDQDQWYLRNDFPNIAPPYPQAWFEFPFPPMVHGKHGDLDFAALAGSRGRVGILVIAWERDEIVGEDIPENLRWALRCDFFLDYGRGRGIEGPHAALNIGVDADGLAIVPPFLHTFGDGSSALENSLLTWVHPVMLAISFMHCKNVTIVDESVPKPLAKKHHAKTGKWPVKYKTLVIEPLKEILRREGKSESVGLQRALHICRGHFRDYREGKGLFGKYHTIVWTPMTVRGTKGDKPPAREIEIKV